MAETKVSEADTQTAQVEAPPVSPEPEPTAVPTEVKEEVVSEAPEVEAQEPKAKPKKKERPLTKDEALAFLAGLPEEEKDSLLDHDIFKPRVQSRADKKALEATIKTRTQVQQELDEGQQIAQFADKWEEYTPEQRQQGLRSVSFNAMRKGQQTAVDTVWDALKNAGIVTMSDEDARVLSAQIGNHPNAMSEFFVRALKGSVMNRKEVDHQISQMVDAKVEERLADLRKTEPTHPELGPSEPPSGKTPEQEWVAAGAPNSGPIWDKYQEWRKSQRFDLM